VAPTGEKRNLYRLLETMSKNITRRVDNIKMDLVEIGWGGVNWIGLAQGRDMWTALVNVVMNILAVENAGKLSRDTQLITSRVAQAP
jgi:predicted small integral membrane protein